MSPASFRIPGSLPPVKLGKDPTAYLLGSESALSILGIGLPAWNSGPSSE
jgi:hypothetical protein